MLLEEINAPDQFRKLLFLLLGKPFRFRRSHERNDRHPKYEEEHTEDKQESKNDLHLRLPRQGPS